MNGFTVKDGSKITSVVNRLRMLISKVLTVAFERTSARNWLLSLKYAPEVMRGGEELHEARPHSSLDGLIRRIPGNKEVFYPQVALTTGKVNQLL